MDNRHSSPEENLLKDTRILNFHAESISQFVTARGWRQLAQEEAARAVYEFCRDEVLFGYNSDADDMPAAQILEEGIGHCNTKSSLLMALLRSLAIPCRLRAFTIDKRLQKGAMTPFVYLMAPREILHTWVEAKLGERWIALEGVILDEQYLSSVQSEFKNCRHTFLGYAVATPCLAEPAIEWTGGDTFIQREGIARELGLHSSPDDFYAVYKTNLTGIKGWLYRNFFYKVLNNNVKRIREGGFADTAKSKECGHQAKG